MYGIYKMWDCGKIRYIMTAKKLLDGRKMSHRYSDTEVSSAIFNRESFDNWLRDHPDVAQNISDESFCKELYQSLTNSIVLIDPLALHGSENQHILNIIMSDVLQFGKEEILDVGRSFRGAGRLVSYLRNFHIGTNESYMDWYCCAGEGWLSPRIEKLYDEINITWREWKG